MHQPQANSGSTASARSFARLLLVLFTAALVVLATEWASSRLVSDELPPETSADLVQRPDNITLVVSTTENRPRPRQRPSIWLVGNSHAYGLPGLQPGDWLRTYTPGITIDELAAGFAKRHPRVEADFYLLGYCNFLPFEMLTRTADLLAVGHRPKVVFLGLMWRNLSRTTNTRYSIAQSFRDESFADAFEQMLADPYVAAAPEVMEELRLQRRKAERDQQQQRVKSDADVLDEILTSWVSSRSMLMGKSAELRAQLFRMANSRFQRNAIDRPADQYFYDMSPEALRFNTECLRALVRLLKRHDAQVFCYWTPQRTDLRLQMAPEPQQEFVERFTREASELGITVLDARRLVPDEYWGWVYQSPDYSHFTEPGHQRLAAFLLDAAEEQGAFKAFDQP